MARGFDEVISPEAIGLTSVGLLLFSSALLAIRVKKRKPPSAEEAEAHRRAWLARYGKLAGGEIVEVSGNTISYTYDVRGIGYTAWQDVTQLEARLPEERWSIIGGVGVRYDPRNPANSIVLAETWTGLRSPKPNSK